ncbi:Hypothetical protein NTJ_11439 [Nesidiocoris tenuis]|uniref:DUF7041 domain-containing protein n=1 Tax=Nesidiocoris tenuis TaxID=355587 RepID=A0ABN7B4U5_9HEMI|nr:Hypothetical protein NTJ_11439 [Nesidiocoris tenuis]
MQEEASESCEVTLKLPPFWPQKPDIWFCQVEAQFKLKRITRENTRFDHLLAGLDPHYLENIYDLVDSALTDKYTQAKNRLISIYKESEESQIKKITSGLELGSLKPSQLLRKMQSLAGRSDFSEKVLKTLWLEKLPEHVRSILVIAEGDLNKLALLADKVCEVREVDEIQPSRSQYVPQSTASTNGNSLEAMAHAIDEIRKQLCELRSRSRSRSSSVSRSRSESRRRNNRPKFDRNGKFCYYHFRFGADCKPEKCSPPCQWEKENENRQRQ